MELYDPVTRHERYERRVYSAAFLAHLSLKTVSEENSKGSWHGWEISLEGPIEDANLYKSAKTFAQSIMKGEVKVKHESEETNSSDIPW